MRRAHFYSPQCVHEDCVQRAHFEFTSIRAKQQCVERTEQRGGWRCGRHTDPEKTLSENNRTREVTLVVTETERGRFWCEEGQERLSGGFVCGPGFRAYAEDFPADTKLIVTARLEMASQTAEDEAVLL
jgi:hypothetical protein